MIAHNAEGHQAAADLAGPPGGSGVFMESHFWLCNIVDETAKFDHVLSALSEDMVGQILDIHCGGSSGSNPLHLLAGPPVGYTLPV